MKYLILVFLAGILVSACQPKSESLTETTPADVKPQPAEFADQKYIDIGKQSLRSLAEGDVAGFMSSIADNAEFSWNTGDSLAGKPAIEAYWKERRGKTIDTMTYVNDVWLTVKANERPAEWLPTGVYLFGWFEITATYANGKKMTQLIHHVYHFDDSDKIDNVTQFVDRAAINAALGSKK